LEGFDERMVKVIGFCTTKGWRVRDQDAGEDPPFDEIAKFLRDKAISAERMSIYAKEHTMHGTLDPANSTISHVSIAVNSPKPLPSDLAVKELVDQVNALSSLIRSIPANPPTVPTATIPILASHPDRVSRCIWCDSPDHSRRSDCTLFAEALETGNVRINEVGHVVLSSTGAEIPPAFGRGGMKLWYVTVCPPPAPSRGLLRMYAYDDRISA
jgi:hypothetical protein